MREDKLFMFWCCTHGWDIDDQHAVDEYGLWAAEVAACRDIDIDSDGHWFIVSAEDILWDQLQKVEAEMSTAEAEMSAAEAGC